jgi:hypothetical protein
MLPLSPTWADRHTRMGGRAGDSHTTNLPTNYSGLSACGEERQGEGEGEQEQEASRFAISEFCNLPLSSLTGLHC